MTSEPNKTDLLLGFNIYVPFNLSENNFKHKDELATNYLTLVEHLETFHNVKTNFYFSGNLLVYLDKKFNDFSPKIRNLLNKNQLELLSGGRYEPLFPFIPKEDRVSQLALMNRLLNHMYGYTSNGAWLTNCAWEPSLALDLAKARIQYTCLPKEHFLLFASEQNKIDGYYLTEEEGRKIAVFPISHNLNLLMEQNTPGDIVNNFANSKDSSILVFYEGPLESKDKLEWLRKFLEAIENSHSLQTRLLNDYLLNNKPKGRAYLQTMRDTTSQSNGHIPSKTFLLKYPEANLLHKKMLRVSKKINSAKEGKSRFKVIKDMINQAQELLFKGQASYIYQDGFLCGIYSPLHRHNVYSDLIKAENLIDIASRQGSSWIQLTEIDYDCDGYDEIIIETETQNLYISPLLAGAILEHDYKPKNLNLINTISRKKEKYHTQSQELIFDNYPKLNLLEHFIHNDVDLQKCKLNNLPHLTKEVITPYQVNKIKAKEQTCKVSLISNATLEKINGNPEIELLKQISVRAGDGSFIVDYTLTNKSKIALDFTFGIEFNFNVSPTDDGDNYFYLEGNPTSRTKDPILRSSEEIKNLNQISIYNKRQGIDLTLFWDKPCTLFRYPIETFSYNYGNLEKILQGVTIFPTWQVVLEPETQWGLLIRQEVRTLIEEQ